jgi:hypothetical protein
MRETLIGETLISFGGRFSQAVASGAGTVVLKAAPGRLCRIAVTAGGIVAFSVFDNASAASGTLLFTSPTTTNLGTIFDIQMPAQNGITVSNPASGPGLTISWD